MKKKATGRFDALWKGVIEDLFTEFMDFFLAKESEDFDLSTVQYLDKELEIIQADKEEDRIKRFADKLILIGRKSNKESKALLHVEVDGSDKADFAERMFVYGALIYTKFFKPMQALVIFTGSRKSLTNQFNFKDGDTEMNYKFGTYCVLEQSMNLLKNSDNPFSLIMLATQLKLREKKLTNEVLMNQFDWIFTKLEQLDLPNKKKITINIYLEDCVRLCLENKDIYPTFVKRLKSITKNNNIMGVAELIKEEGIEIGKEEGIEIGREKGIEIGKEKGIEIGKEEGIEIGREKGIEIGKEKGIEIGKEKGIEIGIEKTNIRIIKVLLNDSNYTVAKIATMLGLSEYYVRKVKRESNLA